MKKNKSKIKIYKTALPKEQLSYNDWCKTYNVGTIRNTSREAPKHNLNSEYHYTKYSFGAKRGGFIDWLKDLLVG